MLGDNPLHQHGLERDFFTDMDAEEAMMLATIGYHYVREREQELKAQEQNKIRSGFADKKYSATEKKEADRLCMLFYERRNGECIAKEAAMTILAKYKNIKLAKMIKNLEKKREEEKK